MLMIASIPGQKEQKILVEEENASDRRAGVAPEFPELCGGLISLDTSIGGKSTNRGIMYE